MLTVSNTALQQFMSGCTYKYALYKKYTRKKMSRPMKFGIEVHELLSEGIPVDPTNDLLAWERAKTLELMADKLGYVILDREVKHIAPLTKDIQVFGVIDVLAELDGVPVLIDWKTAARTWKTIKTERGEVVVPKAAGFQGPIYLTTPHPGSTSDYWGGGGVWPSELHYLLAPTTGTTKRYKYYEEDVGRQNLIQAATLLKDAVDRGWFPKNQGYLCESCEWRNVCYKVPGWERHHGVKE